MQQVLWDEANQHVTKTYGNFQAYFQTKVPVKSINRSDHHEVCIA